MTPKGMPVSSGERFGSPPDFMQAAEKCEKAHNSAHVANEGHAATLSHGRGMESISS